MEWEAFHSDCFVASSEGLIQYAISDEHGG